MSDGSEDNPAPADNPGRPVLVLVTHDCSLSGAPMVVLNMVRQLAASNTFNLFVVALVGGPLVAEFASHCPIEIIGHDAESSGKLESFLTRFAARREKFAFCNTMVTGYLFPIFRNRGFFTVALVHETPGMISVLGPKNLEIIDRLAHAIVFGCEFVRRRDVEAFRLTNPNQLVVPTAYHDPPLDRLLIDAARARLRSELGFPKDSLVVLGCGRVEFRKGTDLFVDLARAVSSHPDGGRLRFAWIGPFFPTTFCSWCLQGGKRQGMDSVIRFVGERPDISLYFPGADLFALTSREDPFPLVNLVAMWARVPVIAFADSGGAPEAIEDDARVVVPHLDVSAMAGAVLALAADPTRRDILGSRGREKFKERYTADRFVTSLFASLRGSGIPLPQIDASPRSMHVSAGGAR